MAIIDKASIQALIDSYTTNITTYITTNGNKDITGAQLKGVLDESAVILEEIKDSYFNLIDEPRTALVTSYPPLVPADWNATIPTEVQSGLDQVASRVRTIENAPAIQYGIQIYANTNSTVSNIFPLYGLVLLFGDERKSSKVTAVSYETSTDGGDTWTARVNFTALDTYLTSATTPTSFILVRAIFTFLGGYVGEQAIVLNYTQA